MHCAARLGCQLVPVVERSVGDGAGDGSCWLSHRCPHTHKKQCQQRLSWFFGSHHCHVSVCVCVYVYIYIYTCVCTYEYMQEWENERVWECECVRLIVTFGFEWLHIFLTHVFVYPSLFFYISITFCHLSMISALDLQSCHFALNLDYLSLGKLPSHTPSRSVQFEETVQKSQTERMCVRVCVRLIYIYIYIYMRMCACVWER